MMKHNSDDPFCDCVWCFVTDWTSPHAWMAYVAIFVWIFMVSLVLAAYFQ
jgi:hypothetical protein